MLKQQDSEPPEESSKIRNQKLQELLLTKPGKQVADAAACLAALASLASACLAALACRVAVCVAAARAAADCLAASRSAACVLAASFRLLYVFV